MTNEIPIETIARHLEEKGRKKAMPEAGADDPQAIDPPSANWLLLGIGALLIVAALIAFSSLPKPAPAKLPSVPAPPVSEWKTSRIGNYSVDAPVELKPLPTSSDNMRIIEGKGDGTQFYMAYGPAPGPHIGDVYEKEAKHVVEKLREDMRGQTISEQDYMDHGCFVSESYFSFRKDEMNVICGTHSVAGNYILATIWVWAADGKLTHEEMQQYLDSFRMNLDTTN